MNKPAYTFTNTSYHKIRFFSSRQSEKRNDMRKVQNFPISFLIRIAYVLISLQATLFLVGFGRSSILTVKLMCGRSFADSSNMPR